MVPTGGEWWMCLMMVLWSVVASSLLFFTWNKVVVYLAGLKEVKLWQALLVFATVAIFCYPKKYKHYHHKVKMHKRIIEYRMPAR